MLTPCVRKCEVKNGKCLGCSRTLEEIRTWKTMDRSDRMRIMNEIKWRGATHKCPKCEGPAYCAMDDGKSSNLCWCMNVEKKEYTPETNYESCMCKNCLISDIKESN